MNKILITILILLISGCTNKPLLNVEQMVIPKFNSGEKLSLSDIEGAISLGAKQKEWVTKKIQPGLIEANINVRSHMAKVTINYTQDNYSISYKDSTNLDYKESKGKLKIHRNYNKWIVNLSNAIHKELNMKANNS